MGCQDACDTMEEVTVEPVFSSYANPLLCLASCFETVFFFLQGSGTSEPEVEPVRPAVVLF